ncbi:MAG: glycosyltransferase [Victivallaceae bacterium]|nr:glycosyltransferase [Victivallaceae bacterium]
MPKISVLMPVYNPGAIVGETICSVLCQTCSDFEFIVIDDGSTEPTRSLLAGFDDPRIRLFRQENRGVAEARNRAVQLARGEYLAFLDHDDLWLPEKLAVQSEILDADSRIGLVYSPVIPFGDAIDRRPPEYERLPEAATASLLAQNKIQSTSCVMIRKSLFSQHALRFDPACVPCDDWDLYLHLSVFCSFACTSEALVRYRLHSGNTSADFLKMYHAGIRVLDRFQREISVFSQRTGVSAKLLKRLCRNNRGKHCYGLAWHCAWEQGGMLTFLQWNFRALFDNPMEFRAYALFLRYFYWAAVPKERRGRR